MFAIVLIAAVIGAVIAAIYYTHTTGMRANEMMREAVRARAYAENVTAELSEQAVQTQQRCMQRVREITEEKNEIEQEARVIYEMILAVRSRANAAAHSLDSIPKVRQSLPHATMLPVSGNASGGVFIDKLVLNPRGQLVFYAARPWATEPLVTEPFVVGQSLTPEECTAGCAATVTPIAPAGWKHMIWSRTDMEPCRAAPGACAPIFTAPPTPAAFNEMCQNPAQCQVAFLTTDISKTGSGATVPNTLRASIVAAYTRFRTELYARLFDGVDLNNADLENLVLQNFHAEDRAYLRSLSVLLEDQTPVSVNVGGSTHVIYLTDRSVPFHAAIIAIVLRYMRYRMQPPIMQLTLQG